MTEADSIQHFESTAMEMVRGMKLCDALPFLRGLLILTEDRPEMDRVRKIYGGLNLADEQMELIAHGQALLPLSPAPARAIHHEPRGGPSA